jgi:diguanylate cyclase (GGDEF)-like protein/PAS domain S-box-containing protein
MTKKLTNLPESAPDLSRLWQQMFDAIPDSIIILDTSHNLLWLNRAMAEHLGVSREEALGSQCFQLLHGSNCPPAGCPHSLLMNTGTAHDAEATIKGVDGTFLISASPLLDAGGKVVGSVHIARDITAQRQIEEELRQERDFTAALLETMDALMMVLDAEGRIIHFNRACERLTGYGAEEMKGKPLWNPLLFPEEPTMVKEVFASLLAGGFPSHYENYWRTREGERRLISWSNTALRRPNGTVQYIIATGLDITERHEAEERMAHLAHYDLLTDLPNRKLFSDRLQQAMARARRSGQLVAVLFLDLDQFKPVNDRFGHDTGDLLLKQVADRIRAAVRETDTVGRIGGDEFVAAIEGLHRPEDVKPVAKKIIDTLQRPFDVEGKICTIGVSIGATFYPRDDDKMETLITKADQTMYEAKKAGGNELRLFRAAASKEKKQNRGKSS